MSLLFSIHSVAWESTRCDLLAVRREVFIVEQGVPEEIEIDDYDAVSLHFLAVDTDGVPIGTARLLPDGRIGRMAVMSRWRRCGVGRSLMMAVIKAARQQGKTEMHLHAQVHSIGFYESLGFEVCGEEFEEAGILHREMHRQLS
ncbi:MAG TPA: GNAT family N-acetyltransferase [Verrucomicrobiales bacterium]|nr:GNAT family N-acetyltransferase [Verrucomicrobiales bacterium]